jgi:hypothetical protein
MKWFERMLNGFEKDEPKEEIVEEVVEEEVVEEPEIEPEPEPEPIETFEVNAEGGFDFEIKERDKEDLHRHNWHFPYYIEFNYEADVEFAGEKIKSKGTFFREPREDERRELYGRGHHYVFHYNMPTLEKEEETYEYLLELLEERNGIMESIRNSIISDMRQHLKEKNLAKLKETLKGKNKLEINMSFQVEKTDRFKNL